LYRKKRSKCQAGRSEIWIFGDTRIGKCNQQQKLYLHKQRLRFIDGNKKNLFGRDICLYRAEVLDQFAIPKDTGRVQPFLESLETI